MCGIVGVINKNKRAINKSTLGKMQKAILHRGPDGQGSYTYQNIGLAMNRLSIIDVKGGNQPLYNEDKSIVIVGNGEIYNYIELQKELTSKGHKLRTGSDIETITHSYEEWGFDCFKKFRGMFAIAMHDKNNNKIIIARDRMGEKPLYYTQNEDAFYFSSELKALIDTPGFNKKINKNSIDLFFHYYFIPEPQTVFENVKKLKSGSYLLLDLTNNKIQEATYWNADDIVKKSNTDPTKSIKKEFAKACELTLRSDVPVGIALSGGIDSGSILAFSAPKYKHTMKAFSIGYEGTPQSDERKMAKKLADQFKVKFIEKEIKTKDVIKHFPKIVWAADDPIADIASHSIYEVNKLARDNNVKVLLSGNGGDEIFWGYPSTVEGLNQSLEKKSWLEKLFKPWNITYSNPNPISTAFFIKKLYTKKFKSAVLNNNYLSMLKKPKSQSKESIIHSTLTNLRDVWLKSDVITLGDRMSMSASVEMRSPFLDYKLIETALSSKKNLESFKLDQKHYLKKAMKGILPDEVLSRPKKGFTPPVGDWISGILKKYGHLLKNGFLVKEGILDKDKLKLVQTISSTVPSYTAYQILIMEIWGRQYVYREKNLYEK